MTTSLDQLPSEEPRVSRRAKRVITLAVACLGLGLYYVSTHHTGPLLSSVANNQPGLYRVTEVDDGDTIKVAQGGQIETVRFIGMDTPEVKDPRKPIQCFGRSASAKTKSLLTGKSVRLVADPIGDNRDKYHRLLRYVYLPDGTFVNELLVKQGYAFAYVVFPFSDEAQFRQDEIAAKATDVGLWKACQVDSSNLIKQTNPEPNPGP